MNSAVRVQTLPDGSTQWTAETFVTTFRQLGPGVVYIASSGPADVFIPDIGKALDDELAKAGRVMIFANLQETTRIAAEARDGWSHWTKNARHRFSALCLVKSKVIEMALSLIGMFSGADVKSCSDPSAFELAMRQAAPTVRLPQVRKSA